MSATPPRVLFVSPTVARYVGGTETVVARLAERIAPRCELTVLSGRCGDAPPVAIPGAALVTLPFAGRDTALNRRLARLGLNPFKTESWTFFRSAARAGVDFGAWDAIATFYEMDAWLLASRRPELRGRMLHVLPGVSRRRLFRRAGERNVLFVGFRGAERARRKWGLEVPAIPLGVDEGFFPDAPREPPRKRRLVFVGRLDDSKHVDWLVELFVGAGLAARGYALEVIGDGPLHDPIVARHGGAPGLSMLGRTPPEAVARRLRDAHLVLHPTGLESFGLTVLEAMAAGVPVITHALPSIRVWAGEHPTYAAHLDRDAWLAAIAAFEDPVRWREASARNVAFARGLGWSAVADRVWSMLDARIAPARG